MKNIWQPCFRGFQFFLELGNLSRRFKGIYNSMISWIDKFDDLIARPFIPWFSIICHNTRNVGWSRKLEIITTDDQEKIVKVNAAVCKKVIIQMMVSCCAFHKKIRSTLRTILFQKLIMCWLGQYRTHRMVELVKCVCLQI